MNNQNTLQVTIKHNYGQKCIYPANERAQQFCKLLGRKTFTHYDIEQLKKMDFVFEVIVADEFATI